MNMQHRSSYRPVRKFIGLLSIGIISLAGGAAPVWADSCVEQVQDLAARYGLSTDLPNAAAQDTSDAPDTNDLAQSGGVIEPPADPNDPAIIDPSRSAQSNTPTLPEVTPGPETGDGAQGLSSADLAILETILVAARSEAERGKEADCFERLSKAREFIADRNTETEQSG